MYELVSLEPVDYLVIGHVSRDLTPSGPHLGGTAAYAALTVRALGFRAGVVTACDPEVSLEIFQDIPVVSVPSKHCTTFENCDEEGGRRQILHHRASSLSFDSVPKEWKRSPIIHLGPIAQEVESPLPESFCPDVLGLTPQGWMRTWDASGKVSNVDWKSADQVLAKAGAVVFSIEDIAGDEKQIEFFAQHTRVLAVTEGSAGARVYWNSDQRRFPAPKVVEVDATGSGDIFAAAFFIRLYVTRDPWEAARFATKLSAYSVRRLGLEGIPSASEIKDCMVEVF